MSTEAKVTDINEARKEHDARQAVAAEDLVFEQTAYEEETEEYIAQLGDAIRTMSPAAVRDGLLTRLGKRTELLEMEHNDASGKKDRMRFGRLSSLPEYCAVKVLLATHKWCTIDLSNGTTGDAVDFEDMHLLAVYVEDGPNEGVWSTSERLHRRLVRNLAGGDAKRVMSILAGIRDHEDMETVVRTMDPHLVPCANGVWDATTKELRPFSPEWVFMAKSPIDCVPDAPMPVITIPDGEEWDVESWMESLAPEDPELVQLFWEVVHAAVFPYKKWDKSVWLVAPSGNNGKGTLLLMIRGLLNPVSTAQIQVSAFGGRFDLHKLITANVNLADENDVGSFSERMAAWKAAITGDGFTIDRKNRTPVTITWRGLDVQCFNESVPRVKDKSDSLLRRLLFLPFPLSFTGRERKYIKWDYVKRTEVLEHVLWRVLNMDVEEFSEPAVSAEAKADWQGGNDTRVDFWREHEDRFVWDLLPYNFLYEVYIAWMKRTNPGGRTFSKADFRNWIELHLAKSDRWEPKGRTLVRSAGKMDKPEHMIAIYEMRSWYNPIYAPRAELEQRKNGTPPDIGRLCTLGPTGPFRGVLRRPGWTPATVDEED